MQHCAKCHDRQEGGQKSPDGSITYGLEEIGTDPLRATNFASPLEGGKPFTRELQAVAAKVKNHASVEANPGEHRGQLDLPEQQIRWLTTLWLRRTAAGRDLGHRSVSAQWIGAHAGRPAQARGRTPSLLSPWGTASTTPSSLATSLSSARCPRRNARRVFVYDTRLAGNSNRGHRYGTRLSSSDREALLEYLKVMDPPDMFGPSGSCLGRTRRASSSDLSGTRQAPEASEWRRSRQAKTATSRNSRQLQLEQMNMEARAEARETDGSRSTSQASRVPGCEVHGPGKRPRGTAGWPFPRAEDLHRRDPLFQYRRTR